jgi:hypothetical protein
MEVAAPAARAAANNSALVLIVLYVCVTVCDATIPEGPLSVNTFLNFF